MVPIRINLKLIKCEFWLDFISFYFLIFLRNNKKKMFSFMASYLFFWKTIWIEKKIWSMKIFKNYRKCSKASIFSINLNCIFGLEKIEIWFSLFWKSCRKLNFFSKNTNPESIGILSRKLKPKYETDAKDNTNLASSSTFFQNFKWRSTSNPFQLI